MKGKEFDETQFYAGYKTVRNHFRKFDTQPFVNLCFEYLRQPNSNEMERLQRHPWLVLLLVKWAIGDEQSFGAGRKKPTKEDVLKALNLILELGKKSRYPSQFEHYTLFLRTIAYQQFIYQEDFQASCLARQFIMFADLPANHFIKTEFHKITGLEINDFLELLFLLYVNFADKKVNAVTVDFFKPVMERYSESKVIAFLKNFSKPFGEIKKAIAARSEGKITAEEYYEQTLFLAYPLVEGTGTYLSIERYVLFRCMEHFIYDRMKIWDAQRFMNEFGTIFERSVERAVQYSQLPYTTEAKLKEIFGDTTKVVDFVITDGDANVHVDAKAVEMAYQGKVAHLCAKVEDRTKLILKAIEQANDVVKNLAESTDPRATTIRRDKNYLIVVTYKDLYLGNGVVLHEGVAKESIDAIRARYTSGGIPLENMYFLNINEFEIFANAIANGDVGLVEGLEKAKASDAVPQTKKFSFLLHLRDWNIPTPMPQYLQDRIASESLKIEPLLKS